MEVRQVSDSSTTTLCKLLYSVPSWFPDTSIAAFCTPGSQSSRLCRCLCSKKTQQPRSSFMRPTQASLLKQVRCCLVLAWPLLLLINTRSNTSLTLLAPHNSWNSIAGVTDEHFIVWMRTAALPTFRKLYGRIDSTIPAGTTLSFNLTTSAYTTTALLCCTHGAADHPPVWHYLQILW